MSKKSPWLPRKPGPVVAAIALFGLSFWLAVRWLPELNLRPGNYPGKFRIIEEAEVDADSFFVSRGEHELSHLVLFHDIGSSIEHARQADILIIGNSRGQLGFDEAYIVAEAEALGLSIFNLSVGHADSAKFARAVMSRHQLRPKVVIANGGDFFYYGDYSDWAREVIAMDRWQAIKACFEYSMAWQLEKRLHHFLPYLDYFQRWRYPWIHYRSPRTGWWQNTRWPDARYPARVGEEKESYKRSLPFARDLEAELSAWDAQLVMTIVPYRKVLTGHLPYLSQQLGVPYILPSFEGLDTADGSHLTARSARQVSEEIWQALIALPEVREKLSLPPARMQGPDG